MKGQLQFLHLHFALCCQSGLAKSAKPVGEVIEVKFAASCWLDEGREPITGKTINAPLTVILDRGVLDRLEVLKVLFPTLYLIYVYSLSIPDILIYFIFCVY